MFSLEQLSKIKGAKEDKTILEFFDVLEKHIRPDELNLYKGEPIEASQLRDDTAVEFENIEGIRENFPDRVGNYLKVPKVVEK